MFPVYAVHGTISDVSSFVFGSNFCMPPSRNMSRIFHDRACMAGWAFEA